VLIVARGAHPARACLSCGVLVSSTAVLTVAHGVAGFETWEVTAPYARGETKKAAGKLLRVHPNYRPNGPENYPEYDLAVLILDGPIDIGANLPTLPGNEMHPINTPLLVVGRSGLGQASGQKMFGAYVTLVAVPNNINLYGGHPSVCRPGDSGGPVYLTQNKHQLVAVVAQHRGFSRANVPTDIFVPLSGRTRNWIAEQLPADSGKRGGRMADIFPEFTLGPDCSAV